MAVNQAFCPQSATFLVTTNGTTLTASTQTVSFAPVQSASQATGLFQCPPNVRVVNTGASQVFISFTNVARVAVVPGANPSLETVVQPGEDRTFNLNQLPIASQTPALNLTLQINTISVGINQALYVTFGEGI
jgi:hypothetical protein